MISFSATYFDGKSSRANEVTVAAADGEIRLKQVDGTVVRTFPQADIVISPPLGKTARSLMLPGGGRCETEELAAVAALEKEIRGNRGMRLVHFLEGSWKLAFTLLAALLFCVWAFLTYGIPFLAKEVAFAVPPAMMEKIGRQTAEVFDRRFMHPSELAPDTRDRLQEVFRQLIADRDNAGGYHLEFRKGGGIGANAFALPSGTILMTDEMVQKSANDRELTGVLLHEIAHLDERHGLRTVFQNTGVFLLISALVGDIASVSSTAASLPTMLAETGYSRKFEQEADEAAARYLLAHNMSTSDYQALLIRITEKAPDFPGSTLLSTHPATADRVKHLQALEAGDL